MCSQKGEIPVLQANYNGPVVINLVFWDSLRADSEHTLVLVYLDCSMLLPLLRGRIAVRKYYGEGVSRRRRTTRTGPRPAFFVLSFCASVFPTER